MNQALRFGIVVAIVGFAALVWPLVLAGFMQSFVAVLWIYCVAFAIDVVLFVLWTVAAIRYSRAAAAGTLFAIPWLAKIAGSATPTP